MPAVLMEAINVHKNTILVLLCGLCVIAGVSFLNASITGIVVHVYIYNDLRLKEYTLHGLERLNTLPVLFLLVHYPALSISFIVLLGINVILGLLTVLLLFD
jgi:hypothetical protein